jgi:drug/metabolite transporter (DMT)-like permease
VTRAQRGARYACVVLAACSWGTWPLILRRADAIAPMDPAVTSTIVMAVMTLIGFAMTLRDRAPGKASLRAWGGMAILGVADALNVLLLFWAYRVTSVAIAVLTHYLTPIFVAIAAPFALGERWSGKTAAAVAVAFGGLVLLLEPWGAPAPHAWVGAALGTGSAVFYATNVIVDKRILGPFSASELLAYHGVLATPLLALFAPAGAWSALDGHALAIVAVGAVGPGALAALLFLVGLRALPASHVSTLALLEPFVAVLLGATFLAEPLRPLSCVGGVLILGGAAAVVFHGGIEA